MGSQKFCCGLFFSIFNDYLKYKMMPRVVKDVDQSFDWLEGVLIPPCHIGLVLTEQDTTPYIAQYNIN